MKTLSRYGREVVGARYVEWVTTAYNAFRDFIVNNSLPFAIVPLRDAFEFGYIAGYKRAKAEAEAGAQYDRMLTMAMLSEDEQPTSNSVMKFGAVMESQLL